MTEMKNKIYLVGDVRYTDNANVIYQNDKAKAPVDFLLRLQELIEEFGVVKIDVSTDAFKYSNYKNL